MLQGPIRPNYSPIAMKMPGPSNVHICQAFKCHPSLLWCDVYKGKLGLLKRLVVVCGDHDGTMLQLKVA